MDTTIKLGTFIFQDLEIPEIINFGGAQQLVNHKLIGGARVVDSLGKDDTEITWHGRMTGPTALTRAQTLNQMRAAGQQLNFTWFNLSYIVVIQNFVAYTERFYQVPYDITLMVISDGANPISTQSVIGFNEAIQGDFTQANKLATNINNPTITNIMSKLGTVINSVSTFNDASQATLSPVSVALTTALAGVSAAITPIGQRLFGKGN